MAASHHKIVIGAVQTAGQAVSYLADPQAAGDYYSAGGLAFMRWFTTPRARTYFALGETMNLSALEQLLQGRSPVDGELLRKWGPDGTMVGGIDVTLSPPKSVSVLWALGDRELRRELESVLGQAVSEVIGRMLRTVPLVRERYGPGPSDVRRVKADDWVVAQALHSTARLTATAEAGIPDPQLHIHNVLIGALDAFGRLRAFESRAILQYIRHLNGDFLAQLAEMMRERGWEIERQVIPGPGGRVKRVSFEVAAVPDELVTALSSRRGEIEDLRDDYRQLTGREPTGTSWERYLQNHRGAKSKRSQAEMDEWWDQVGRSHGFDREALRQARAAAAAVAAPGIPERMESSPQAEVLRKEILRDLCRDHAFVTEAQMDAFVANRSVGLLDPLRAMDVVADMFGDGDLLMTTDRRVTTLEVLAQEQRTVKAAERLLDAPPQRAVDRRAVEAEVRRLEQEGRPLDEGQRTAVDLATAGARLVSITGPAGTGKGYASESMVTLWHAQGRRVFAAAVAGRTAQQAGADSGADPITLDSLSKRIERGSLRLTASDVVLVDEAGMIDHSRYAKLVSAVADSGATLVQIGDDLQLSPVGPGGLWTVTHRMAQARGQATELRQVHRTRNEAEIETWQKLRRGEAESALLWYRDEDRLRLYDTRPELLQGMVADWWTAHQAGTSTSKRAVIVVDTSNAERDVLNRLAQEKRAEAGEIGQTAVRLAGGRELHENDRVIFRAIHELDPTPGPAQERRVENGTEGTVVQVDPVARTAVLQLDEPRRKAKGQRARGAPETPPRQITVGPEVPVELAYARHVAKAQGMTGRESDVALSGRTSLNQGYTMLSRSQEGSRVHALRADVADLGVDVGAVERGATASPAKPGLQLANGRQVRSGDRVVFGERHRLHRDLNAFGPHVEQGTPATVLALGAVELEDRSGLLAAERGERANDLIERRSSQYAAERAARPKPPNVAVVQVHEAAGDREVVVGVDVPLVEEGRPAAERATQATTVPAPAVEERAEPKAAEPGIPWSEVEAKIEADRANREARAEYATIRQYGRQLSQATTKQAIGAPEWIHGNVVQPAKHEAAEQRRAADRGQDRQGWELRRTATPSREVATPAAVSRTPERQAQAEPHRAAAAATKAMPARDAHESYARSLAEQMEPIEASQSPAGQAVRRMLNDSRSMDVLAHYEAAGRLELAADPHEHAARLWKENPTAAIVVRDEHDAHRVREAIARINEEPTREAPSEAPTPARQTDEQSQGAPSTTPEPRAQPPPEPTILRADVAYAERAQRREQWQTSAPAQSWHHVEPGAVDRALVVAPDRSDHVTLLRGLSVAAESRLVTAEPSAVARGEIQIRAADITSGMASRARAEHVRQATTAAELAAREHSGANRPSAQRTAQREAGTAGPTPAQAQRGGAER